MNGPVPHCPECHEPMEAGHVLYKDNSGRLQQITWTEGVPEKGGMLGFKVKGKRQYPSMTWRCPRCGWMLWFAPEPEVENEQQL